MVIEHTIQCTTVVKVLVVVASATGEQKEALRG